MTPTTDWAMLKQVTRYFKASAHDRGGQILYEPMSQHLTIRLGTATQVAGHVEVRDRWHDIALEVSGGEAEIYGVWKVAAEGESERMAWLMRRTGVRVNHVETCVLRVQDQVVRGWVKMKKIDGTTKIADVLLTTLLRRLPVVRIAAQLQGRTPCDSVVEGRRGGIVSDSYPQCADFSEGHVQLDPRGIWW